MKSKNQLIAELQEKQQALVNLPESANWQDEYEIQSDIIALREELADFDN